MCEFSLLPAIAVAAQESSAEAVTYVVAGALLEVLTSISGIKA